eukprot:TRINITY_DN2156_c0_g1_i8.p2 TRINITY_DN2156_c0_g1~~TRINITY_DN2156_c0_g1_i8.p2  ORF type:complete len:108 (+),score=6.23 TRINITY_DN2156_c0_g1_i8:33-326(+)
MTNWDDVFSVNSCKAEKKTKKKNKKKRKKIQFQNSFKNREVEIIITQNLFKWSGADFLITTTVQYFPLYLVETCIVEQSKIFFLYNNWFYKYHFLSV